MKQSLLFAGSMSALIILVAYLLGLVSITCGLVCLMPTFMCFLLGVLMPLPYKTRIIYYTDYYCAVWFRNIAILALTAALMLLSIGVTKAQDSRMENQLFIKIIKFEQGSATLSENTARYIMEELKGCDIVSIMGYASSEGIGDSNLVLSQARAAYIGATLGKLDICRGGGATDVFGSKPANRIVLVHYYRPVPKARAAKPLAQVVTDCNRLPVDTVVVDSCLELDTLEYTTVPTLVGTITPLHNSIPCRTFALDSAVIQMGMPMDEPICITCELERQALVYARGQLWDRKQEWRAEGYRSAKTRKTMALLVQDIDWLDNEYKRCLKQTRETWDAGFYGNSASSGGGGQKVSMLTMWKGGRAKTKVGKSKRACKGKTGGESL